MKLLVATRSAGKMREIRRILEAVPDLEVLSLDDAGIGFDPEEDGLEPFDTFEENALSKARYFLERARLPTVADDSGIVIDALDGAPGVRSKRFAPDAGAVEGGSAGAALEGGQAGAALDGLELDRANNRHLVASLAGVPYEERTARYVCVAVLVERGGDPIVTRGEAHGIVVDAPRGVGGFGYDPHVLEPETGRTYAEMTPEEKDARSHRGQAFRALAVHLAARRG